MRWLSLIGGLSCFLLLPARAGHSPPLLLMRVYVQTSGDGLPSTQARSVSIPPDGETIMIRALPEATEAELTDVHEDASRSVHFQFNHQGQINLDAVTAQNQGRILVVMINGEIVYAPTIDEELSTGELIIPHPFRPDVLQALQELAKRNVANAKKT